VPEDSGFARIVSLACHDLRTPLATVQGFARTIPRFADLPEQPARHLRMIDEAASEMAGLLDQVGLLARIERGVYQPNLVERDSLELARAAAERVPGVRVQGSGARVPVDEEAVVRSLASLARAALRHGGLAEVRMDVHGSELTISPTTAESAPVFAGEELRDLGTAVARRVLEELGGSLSLDQNSLLVRLPQE
jgi:signal transduction histidine kinase